MRITQWRCTVLAAALVALGSHLAVLGQRDTGALSVQRVMPRPRLFFAPGEFARFLTETRNARAAFFDTLLAFTTEQGSRDWNERDLQLESQALLARVLTERRDGRGQEILALARKSLRYFLDRHTFTQYRDVHEMVTAGSRWLEAVALAYDWAYPLWTAGERDEMTSWLRAEIDYWVDGNRVAQASPSPFRNDLARGVSGLVAAGLAIFDEPGARGAGGKALAYALPFYQEILDAHRYAGADGGLAEGSFYGALTAWSHVMVAEMLYTGAGQTDAFHRSPFFTARLRYGVHAAWPGYITNQFNYNTHHLAPIFGDARRGPTGSTLRHRSTMLLLGKRLAETDAARQAYAVVNRPETGKTHVREWRLYDLLLWSSAVSSQMPTALTYREGTLGQVFARSDWGDNATWLSFNAGPHLDTHQHYDAGNLTIHRNGVDLLVDSGSLDAFGTRHWFNYYIRTVAHNTVLVTDPQERWEGIWSGVEDDLAINDGGQRTAAPLTPAPTLNGYLAARAAYDQASIERYATGDWGLYLKSNLTNAYQNPRYQSNKPDRTRNRVKVNYVGREVVYLRRGEGRRDGVVVFDRVISADPAFRKAVLWHAADPFTTTASGRRIDEGERVFDATRPLTFQTTPAFRQGDRNGRARLFITVLPVDPVRIREIGSRPSTGTTVDHETFGTKHFHRHVKDYFVDDSRVSNPDTTTGASNRQEWPPIAPPEVQWLWNDDLAGGWGKTRLQVEPAAPEIADRFLTLLVPTDANDDAQPRADLVRGVDGRSAGVRWSEGSQQLVVLFGTENSGGDLTETSAEISQAAGQLLIVGLASNMGYRVAASGAGARRRVDVAVGGSLQSGPHGILRLDLNTLGQLGGSAEDQNARATAGHPGLSPPMPAPRVNGPDRPTSAPIIAGTPLESRRWSGWLDERLRDGRLALKSRWSDPLVAGRIVERLEQRLDGVPVYGYEVVVQRRGDTLEAVFGAIAEIIVGDSGPAMTPASARRAIEHAAGISLPRDREPSLFIVRQPDGGGVRGYCDRVLAREGPRTVCVDAGDGRPALMLDETRRQARQGNRHPVYRLEDDESIVGYVNGLIPLSARDQAAPEAGSTAEAVRDQQAALAAAWAERYGLGDLMESRIVAIVRPAGGRLPVPMYLGRGVLLYPDGSVTKNEEGRGRVAHELSHVLIDRSSGLLPVGEAATLEEDFAVLMEELAAGRRRADAGPVRTAFWDAADDMPGERARIEHAFVRAFTRLVPRGATPALMKAAVLSAYTGLGGSADRLAETWRTR